MKRYAGTYFRREKLGSKEFCLGKGEKKCFVSSTGSWAGTSWCMVREHYRRLPAVLSFEGYNLFGLKIGILILVGTIGGIFLRGPGEVTMRTFLYRPFL